MITVRSPPTVLSDNMTGTCSLQAGGDARGARPGGAGPGGDRPGGPGQGVGQLKP